MGCDGISNWFNGCVYPFWLTLLPWQWFKLAQAMVGGCKQALARIAKLIHKHAQSTPAAEDTEGGTAEAAAEETQPVVADKPLSKEEKKRKRKENRAKRKEAKQQRQSTEREEEEHDESGEKGEAKSPKLSADSLTSQESEWKHLSGAIEHFMKRVQASKGGESTLAFDFQEGMLVKAYRDGHWLLLDEINLASAETLQRLSGLLEGSQCSLRLIERGDAKPLVTMPTRIELCSSVHSLSMRASANSRRCSDCL